MKQLQISLFAVLGLAALGGCSKQLNLKPTDSLTETNAFQTIGDAQLGANQVYADYGAYWNDMYMSALVSDEGKLGSGNAGQGALTYRYQYSSDGTTGGDVIGAYSSYYVMIDQINRVLAALPNVTAATGQEPRRNILKGQLLALRAIAHFELLQVYCKAYTAADPKGVPIMLVSNVAAQPARNKMGDVLTQVFADLNAATALLPAVTPASFTDTTINQVTIAAYIARIALYSGDYQKAIDNATAVINSNVKPLATGANYTGIWTDLNTLPTNPNNEVLFRIQYLSSGFIGSLWTTSGNSIYVSPSDKLVADYGAGDIRKAAFIGGSAGNYYVNKFFTSSRGARAVDIKAIRTSEMYLIRAEAYAKLATPNIAAGAADLNALRAQRISPYTNQIFATASDLITAVMDERYKELCFEGFRIFDLKRNNLPVQRNASDASSAWQTLAAGNYRFVMPIPQTEILANPNMVQNDGY